MKKFSSVDGTGKLHNILNIPNIIYEKLHDSDWLREVQFKCNTSANYTS